MELYAKSLEEKSRIQSKIEEFKKDTNGTFRIFKTFRTLIGQETRFRNREIRVNDEIKELAAANNSSNNDPSASQGNDASDGE